MDYYESWHEEKSSAYLYRKLAEKEKNEVRKKLFNELEVMANKQASLWEKELNKIGKTPPPFSPSLRARFVAQLIQYFNPQQIRFILSAMKVRGMSIYLNLNGHGHEHHQGISSANNLRAAVFGINDGLVSNMSLLLGIAGATTDQHFILLSGIAGMLAGACSMGAGEYISVRSQREFYEYQIGLEKSELEQYPEEEASELAAIYRARGMPKEESEKLAKLLINDPEKALDTLAREELGLNPNDLGSPKGAAFSSFFSFLAGAIIPLLPFFFGVHQWNLLISACLTGMALFGTGALLSFFNNRTMLYSGGRMLLIGASAGLFTYLIGLLIGTSI